MKGHALAAGDVAKIAHLLPVIEVLKLTIATLVKIGSFQLITTKLRQRLYLTIRRLLCTLPSTASQFYPSHLVSHRKQARYRMFGKRPEGMMH